MSNPFLWASQSSHTLRWPSKACAESILATLRRLTESYLSRANVSAPRFDEAAVPMPTVKSLASMGTRRMPRILRTCPGTRAQLVAAL